jgi:O-acetyl-ADP-ribose deacetylase (regulator of RNase III)
MKTIKGDLIEMALDGKFDVIVHGCNCFRTMGAGIARQIAKQWPGAFAADEKTPKGDSTKLGTYSMYVTDARNGRPLFIVNAYTQFDFRGPKNVNYTAIRDAFRGIKESLEGSPSKLRIGIPKIGCGLAGGDWIKVEAIIDDEMRGEDITCVEYEVSNG